MKSIKYFLLALIPLILVSCKTPSANFNDLHKITKKTLQNQFFTDYSKLITETKTSAVDNVEYKIFTVLMLTSTDATTESYTTTSYGSNGRSTSTQSSKVKEAPVYSYYYFVFRNEKFFFSGFMYEFLRHTDPLMRKIFESAVSNSEGEKK